MSCSVMTKTLLISGGNGGIGRALSHEVAAKGLLPILGYRSGMDEAKEIADQCGGRAVHLDLSDHDSIDRAVTEVSGLGQLAGIVLAASPPPSVGPFGRIDPDESRLQWQVNVAGPQRLLQALIRTCLQPQKTGVVLGILTAGMGDGKKPAARGMGGYIIAKYGQCGLLAVLAAEYPWLRVRSIRPSYTRTRMLEIFDERFLDLIGQENPIRLPEEVARDIIEELEL
ncbi:NAD(P)-dependent dehydrogenase, short-chain alcohol dehydrogenase family [Bradyrhizobium erythrophlei]|uniref:NAD(P)-dependent dehydrogenase, short-chain alcohol dehydrogenase family n=1 Tax=Bradyrhizobium erythrophlei TaxID=1437360 RepID=A0A1M5UNC0_9BRAD|nr:NAD(P)-dependent dehydrogenase, short-chain alcohol dehydrogenase family [Bradyrhizobium erythrophlei]